MPTPRPPKKKAGKSTPKNSLALVPVKQSKPNKWEAMVDLGREGYRDFAKKPLRETGDLLTLLLVPLTAIVAALAWRYADGTPILEAFKERITAKLKKIDPSHRRPPSKPVAGPLLLHYPFVAEDEELRDLFENLLAASMSTQGSAHPAFVEALKQMTGAEARILKVLARLVSPTNDSLPMLRVTTHRKHPDGSESLAGNEIGIVTALDLDDSIEHASIDQDIDNLMRLGVLDRNDGATLLRNDAQGTDDLYDHLYESAAIQALSKRHTTATTVVRSNKGILYVRPFGLRLIGACVGGDAN